MGIKQKIRIFLFALFALPSGVVAQEQHQHIVQPGNTLYSIAREHKSTVDAILSANPGISENELVIGETLIVPIPVPQEEVAWRPMYHFHQVRSAESVFSISHKYGITDSTLYWHNPLLEGKPLIKKDQWLRIPKHPERWVGQLVPPFNFDPSKSDEQVASGEQVERQQTPVAATPAPVVPSAANEVDTVRQNEADLTVPYTTYVVREGDSPKKLAGEWGMRSVREFYRYNPEARSNWHVGLVLLQPNAAERELDSTSVGEERTPADTIYVEALLPVLHRDYVNETKLGERSAVALEFYQGMLLAAQHYKDSSRQEVVLRLSDTQNHRDTLRNLLAQARPETDLYIGPLFAQRVQEAARLLPPAMIASPLSRNEQLLSTGVWNTPVGEPAQWKFLAHHLSEVVAAADTALFSRVPQLPISKTLQTPERLLLVGLQDQAYQRVYTEMSQHVPTPLITTLGNTEKWKENERLSRMDTTVRYALVIASEDPAFILDVLRNARNGKLQFTWFATQSQVELPGISSILATTSPIIAAFSSYTNYSNEATLHWIQQFRKRFGHEPSKYAFAGYDNLCFHLKRLSNGTLTYKGIHQGFKFEEGNHDNQFVELRAFQNYEWVEAIAPVAVDAVPQVDGLEAPTPEGQE